MLLKFQVTNHRSIRKTAEISFVATSLKEQSESLVPCPYTKHGVLPVLALYGANASGKSNLLDSMAFFRDTILCSFVEGDTESGMAQHPFLLDDDSRKLTSTYIADFVLDGVRHQYGFAINSKRVVEEWLYQFPKQARQILFYRKAGEETEFFFGPNLKGRNREVEAITRSNTLFLSAAMKAGHTELSPIATYFRNALQFRLNPRVESAEILGIALSDDFELKRDVTIYLSIADTGIIELDVEEKAQQDDLVNELLITIRRHSDSNGLSRKITQELKALYFLDIKLGHQSEDGKTRKLDFDDESLGTKYLLTILIPMLDVLKNGKLLILDEITTSLHTLLARKLVTLFMDPKINTKGAQLLFTTHDTNLLAPGLLRRDQVWFAEIVIVSEGKRTEPEYFKRFANLNRNGLVEVKLVGLGAVPSSVVSRAIEEFHKLKLLARKQGDSYKFEVWAVFDRDEHVEFDIPIQKAEKHEIKVAYSNPCFEIWGLMHYRLVDGPIHSHSAQRGLHAEHPSYHHNDNPVLDADSLQGKPYQAALNNAERALTRRKEEDNERGNPSTTVHLLTERTRKYGQK